LIYSIIATLIGAETVGIETNVCTSLGSKVTLVAKSSEPHLRFAEAGKFLRDAFVQQGINVHVSIQVAAVRGNGPYTIELSSGKNIASVTKILAATC
jgi:pyruvate/2-oxoglutarate dehydrogenase complex dihydrolipoamide dehydrogenase (E3) component